MDALRITGGVPLTGTVTVSGAKNAALPMMAAAILADGPVTLHRVPELVDVRTLARLLSRLGVTVRRDAAGAVHLENVDTTCVRADRRLVARMRASFCVLGPLLARRGRAVVAMPGGCAIGQRPVDLHLHGLAARRRHSPMQRLRDRRGPAAARCHDSSCRPLGPDRDRHGQRHECGDAGPWDHDHHRRGRRARDRRSRPDARFMGCANFRARYVDDRNPRRRSTRRRALSADPRSDRGSNPVVRRGDHPWSRYAARCVRRSHDGSPRNTRRDRLYGRHKRK